MLIFLEFLSGLMFCLCFVALSAKYLVSTVNCVGYGQVAAFLMGFILM